MPSFPFTIKYYSNSGSQILKSTYGELFFILSGNAEIRHSDNSFPVLAEDIFYVNANDAYHINGSDWEAISVSFSGDLSQKGYSFSQERFRLSSAFNTYSTKYDFIKYCIFHLVKAQSNSNSAEYNTLSIFYALINHLSNNFSYSENNGISVNRRNQEKLISINEYITKHFAENLTLNQVADHFGLTSPYLSSFFKKYTDTTFSEYYNEIRLNHALSDLLSSNYSIEDIAAENGFSDYRSFSSTFKKKYGMLPSIFRKTYRDPNHSESTSLTFPLSIPTNLHLRPALAKYANVFHEKEAFYLAATENPKIIDAGSISFNSPGIQLNHTYRNMICVGSAKQLLYKEVQDMLCRVKKEINIQQIKFHGLLSDDMMVYHEDADGTPHYSFTFIDKAFDFLQSIGINPLCQLSFMPIELAEDPWRLVDFYHFNTAPPKSLKKWTDLIAALIQHLVKRYGKKEVSGWMFCVWNEPDDTVEQFSWTDRNRFFEFYEHTYKTVKNILPEVQFGTPSMLISIQDEYGWAADFFQYSASHECIPDFLNIHYYDNSIFGKDTMDRVRGQGGFSAENMESSFPLTVDQYAFVKFIDNVKMLTREHDMKNIPIYLTEWNLTISHRDLINDTCFKSCHLIKNLLENYDRLSSFSYWCLTDFVEELQMPNALYHGGLGLFTFNGIPKANYTALSLLSRLGDDLLAKGDGFFITKRSDSLCIVLYNYEHYSKLFASGARIRMTSTDRYSAFEEMNTAQAALRITGLNYSRAIISERYVNQLAGSSFDAWARIGIDIDSITSDELGILKYHSQPGLIVHQENIENGSLSLHIKMLPLEVRVIDVKLI